MELSTSMPIPRARPPKDMIFNVMPAQSIRMNEVMMGDGGWRWR